MVKNEQKLSKRSEMVQNGPKWREGRSEKAWRAPRLLVIQYFSSSWLQIEMLKGQTHLCYQNKSSWPIFEVFVLFMFWQ